MSYEVYAGIGIFMAAKRKEEVLKKEIFIDNNGFETKNRFDPKTGQENKKNIIEEKIKSWPEAHLGPEKPLAPPSFFRRDMFFSPEYHPEKEDYIYFLFNYPDEKYFKSLDVCNDDIYIQDLSAFFSEKLIKEFKEKYAIYLDYYENIKGYEIEIRSGLINYSF